MSSCLCWVFWNRISRRVLFTRKLISTWPSVEFGWFLFQAVRGSACLRSVYLKRITIWWFVLEPHWTINKCRDRFKSDSSERRNRTYVCFNKICYSCCRVVRNVRRPQYRPRCFNSNQHEQIQRFFTAARRKIRFESRRFFPSWHSTSDNSEIELEIKLLIPV